MKLYYFNPNTYGEEAFVCAESPEKAKEYLLASPLEVENPTEWEKKYHKNKIEDMVYPKGKYTLEEYPVGKVVFTEIA